MCLIKKLMLFMYVAMLEFHVIMVIIKFHKSHIVVRVRLFHL